MSASKLQASLKRAREDAYGKSAQSRRAADPVLPEAFEPRLKFDVRSSITEILLRLRTEVAPEELNLPAPNPSSDPHTTDTPGTALPHLSSSVVLQEITKMCHDRHGVAALRKILRGLEREEQQHLLSVVFPPTSQQETPETELGESDNRAQDKEPTTTSLDEKTTSLLARIQQELAQRKRPIEAGQPEPAPRDPPSGPALGTASSSLRTRFPFPATKNQAVCEHCGPLGTVHYSYPVGSLGKYAALEREVKRKYCCLRCEREWFEEE
ncbi:unnamed protein product [Amoebophrya sp. A120]|nr:unnamed protein product [Amoebophrya sp. A120]|eukprot:GSA120T00023079001.1